MQAYQTIISGCQPEDIIHGNSLIQKLNDGHTLTGYIGFAPTGKCHLGYLIPLMKIADCVRGGCNMVILLADVHAHLDSRKSGLEDESRTKYYELLLTECLKLLQVDMSRITFVRGSDFQYSKPYVRDLLTLLNEINISKAKKAGAEVVKQADDPLLSSLVYPIMQSLDESYVHPNIDFELGGVDQQKIFGFSIDHIHKRQGTHIAYVMTRLAPGLSNKSLRDEQGLIQIPKMSSSEKAGKVELLDDPKDITKKLNKVYCVEGDGQDNTLLMLCENVIFPLLAHIETDFILTQYQNNSILINQASDLRDLFIQGKVHPADLKKSIAICLSDILKPVREAFATPEAQELVSKAYP